MLKFFGTAAQQGDGLITPKASTTAERNPFDSLQSPSPARKQSTTSFLPGARTPRGSVGSFAPAPPTPSFFGQGTSGPGDVTPGASPFTPGGVPTTGS